MAAEYNHQIYRQRTALEEILQKLSNYFEDYVRILSYMRSAYLDFAPRISDEDLSRFTRQLKDYEKKNPL